MRNWRCRFRYFSSLRYWGAIRSRFRSVRNVDLRNWTGWHFVSRLCNANCLGERDSWFWVGIWCLVYCNLCLPTFDRVSRSGAQGGKATSQTRLKKQDFWDETAYWLVRNFDRSTIPARTTLTPGNNDADSCGVWLRLSIWVNLWCERF